MSTNVNGVISPQGIKIGLGGTKNVIYHMVFVLQHATVHQGTKDISVILVFHGGGD